MTSGLSELHMARPSRHETITLDLDGREARTFAEINAARAKRGLPALPKNILLESGARVAGLRLELSSLRAEIEVVGSDKTLTGVERAERVDLLGAISQQLRRCQRAALTEELRGAAR